MKIFCTILSILTLACILMGSGVAPAIIWQQNNSTVGSGNTLNILPGTNITTSGSFSGGVASITINAAGGGSGGGIVTYSGASVVLSGGSTVYVPFGGDTAGSGTEANVSMKVQPVASISNACVTLSSAPGGGNSIAVTLRDAGANTTITMTVSGAATSACDTTHTVTNGAGDLLDWSLAPNGVIAAYTPNVSISAQFGSPGGVSSVQTLTGAVTLFNNNAQTATYQVLAADFTHCKTITVASGTFTITLVASGSQPPDGQCIEVLNYGSGTVTVAASGQNINGSATSQVLAAGSASAPTGLQVFSDGTNYFAQPLGANSSGGGSAFFSGSLTTIVPGNWSSIGSGGSSSTVTGAAGGNALKITGLAGSGTNGDWAGEQVSVAGATWTKTIVIYGPTAYSTSGGTTATQVCVGFTDGTKVEGIAVGYLNNGVPASGAITLTNVTSGTIGVVSSSKSFVATTGPVFVQLVKSAGGNTLSGYVSADGANWDQIFTESGPFLTASGVAVIGSARGGSFGPTFYLESFQ